MSYTQPKPQISPWLNRRLLDDVVLQRQTTGTDAEGNPKGALTEVYVGRGTLVQLSDIDLQIASRAGTEAQATLVLPLSADVRPNDRASVQGRFWHVVGLGYRRAYQRALLRLES